MIEQRYKASLTPHGVRILSRTCNQPMQVHALGTIPPRRPYPVGDALFHTMSNQWPFDFESVDNGLLVIKVESIHGLKPLCVARCINSLLFVPGICCHCRKLAASVDRYTQS